MEQWYYHAPGRGRVGPLDAEAMRVAFRHREIDRDTLVWRSGLPEWQPLVRVLDALDLEGVQPEAHRPPPLPPPSAARPTPPPAPAPRTPARAIGAAQAAPAPAFNRRGCLIVVAIVGVLLLAGMGVLAAIAIPAYNAYRERIKAEATGLDPAGQFDPRQLERVHADTQALIVAAMESMPPEDGCPDDYQFESVQVRRPGLAGDERGWSTLAPARAPDGVCAYDATFRGLGLVMQDGTVHYEAVREGDGIAVRCRGVNLPADAVPEDCRP